MIAYAIKREDTNEIYVDIWGLEHDISKAFIFSDETSAEQYLINYISNNKNYKIVKVRIEEIKG